MGLLIAGLLLFFVAHLVPTRPQLRLRLVGQLGDGGYKGLFSVAALFGVVLIVVGFGQMQGLGRGNPTLWQPPTWARHVTFLLMAPAMILLVAAYVPSRIRDVVRHPMLAAIKIWAFAHLLANGDLAALLLFGSFLAYAIYDRISVKQRDAGGPLADRRASYLNDVIVVTAGLALYAFMLVWGHAHLIGVALL